MSHRIGVCSWSLRAENPADLVARLQRCGLDAVQLALDPIRRGDWNCDDVRSRLDRAGVAILSGMMATADEDYSTLESIRITGGVRSDQHWHANLEAAQANADIALNLGISLVTFHPGFLPENPNDPLRQVMLDRLCRVAEVFASRNVAVAFETGQESAATLLDVLNDLGGADSRAGVNFDPANMILYGMGEPVAALRKLALFVRQIHIKDARPSPAPGTWGTETVVGGGAVNWPEFFTVIRDQLPDVNLVIEREARQERLDDIRAAHDLVRAMLWKTSESPDG